MNLKKADICSEMLEGCRCEQNIISSNHISVEALSLVFSAAVMVTLTKALAHDYKTRNKALIVLLDDLQKSYPWKPED